MQERGVLLSRDHHPAAPARRRRAPDGRRPGLRRRAADRERPRATAGRWTPRWSRCPVRILWGLEDRLLPWPRAAERYRRSLHAEWVELDGVGHAPQLDVPLETAQLIVGFTAM